MAQPAAAGSQEQLGADALVALRDALVEAAHLAGRLMLAHTGRVAVEDSKSCHQDLVTVVDKQCQDVIKAHLLARFPTACFLGEEDVAPGAAASAAAIRERQHEVLLFIADPIDGTTNFVCDLGLSVVSIGAAHRGELVACVVHHPYRSETFAAARGSGAWLNGSRHLRVSGETALNSALVAYGLGHSPRIAGRMLAGLGAVIGDVRGARSLGSAALHLAYVAAGRLELFWELDLSSWDVAAGALLVTEAGGRIGSCAGEPYSLLTRDMFASCGAPAIHDGMLALLAAAGAERL